MWVAKVIGNIQTAQILIPSMGRPQPPPILRQLLDYISVNTLVALGQTSFPIWGSLKMYSTQTSTWSDQEAPLITGTAEVSTYVGSQGYWKYPDGTNIDPFYGTSAAAPHIAAIAGLYFSKYTGRTRANFISDLGITENVFNADLNLVRSGGTIDYRYRRSIDVCG